MVEEYEGQEDDTIDDEEEAYMRYLDGESAKSLMQEYGFTPKQWKDIKNKYSGNESKESSKKTKKEKPNQVEEKIEKAASKSAVDVAVKQTTKTATDIQQTKFEMGDAIYNVLFAANVPNDKMLEFVASAISFYLENYNSVEDYKKQIEASAEVISYFTDLFDDRKQLLKLVEDYQKQCIMNSEKPDPEYVLKLFKIAMVS